jgi:hypothetical protein
MPKLTVTIAEGIAELKAELSIRKNVYRQWISAGRMRPEIANKKFAAMQGALKILIDIEEGVRVGEKDLPATQCLTDFSQPREVEGLPE